MAEEASGIQIGIVGFGEVGSALGAGLNRQGVERLVAYDKGQDGPPFGELIRRRAREAGVPLVASIDEVVRQSELILVAVPGSTALEAATAAARYLKPGQMYVDMGTASPPIKEKMAELVEGVGASFIDVSIMGSPLDEQHRMPTLASGREAGRYWQLVEPLGMNVTVVGDRPGRAAAIKMFRSIFMKGIEALAIETLMACRVWGVENEVMGTVTRTMDREPFWPEHTSRLVRTDAIHAERRAKEMDMVTQTLLDIGVEPRMTRATANMIHWTAGLGLKEHFQGEVPSRWEDVIDEILRRAGALAEPSGRP